MYFIFRVCVCSLSYSPYSAHATYYLLRSVRLYNIFPPYLVKDKIFEKKITEYETSVLTFPANLSEIILIVRRIG